MNNKKWIRVPARQVPIPASVSKQAQTSLWEQSSYPASAYPDPADTAAWLRMQTSANAAMVQDFRSRPALGPDIEGRFDSEPIDMDGVAGFLATPLAGSKAGRIIFDIHGGGLTCGNGEICGLWGAMWSRQFDAPVYSVDYRLPPLHPYPTPLDDCLTAYGFLLGQVPAEQIVVQGVSAGGNLAAALMLRLRDMGLPFPAGLILGSPEVDLTESGDSFQTNLGHDTVLKSSLMAANLLYADGCDLADPCLSPLFGDFSMGFPPTLITSGTRDLFLSNAVRLHNRLRRAGNSSELLIEEAMPHGGLGGSPEDRLLAEDIKGFAESAWSGLLVAKGQRQDPRGRSL